VKSYNTFVLSWGSDRTPASALTKVHTVSITFVRLLSIQGNNGSDVLDGGPDDDNLDGGLGDDRLNGFTGNDLLYGDDGNDEIHGYMGRDTLDGGGGNDILYGQQHGDLLRGGYGDDVLYGEDNGKQGQSYDGSDDNDTLQGDFGKDYLFGGLGNDYLDGGNDNDYLDGGNGNDNLKGGLGNDNLDGGDGNDSLNGEDGNDVLFGRGGNDYLEGYWGNDNLNGGDGEDSLFGSTGDDILRGEAGNDSLVSGTGNDVLDGGDGNDSLYGEGDNDTLSGGNGSNVLDGGDGTDTADYRFSSNPVDVNLINGNARFSGNTDRLTSIENVIGSGSNDVLVGNTGNNTLSGQSGNDSLYGESGNDLLRGEEGNDELHGWEGNDTLEGGTGNDTLYGQQGNDSIQGGDGNDLLYGDDSNDTLNGGAGNDSLFGGAGDDYFEMEEGSDTINGREGTDTLVLSGTKDLYNFTETATGWRILAPNGDVKIAIGVENFEFKSAPQVDNFDLSSVFDRDVIINKGFFNVDSSQTGLSTLNETLVTQSFAQFKASWNPNGLPDNGFFSANAYHPDVQLGYKNDNFDNNAKVLTTNNTSFTFNLTSKQYSAIHLFATSTRGNAEMEVTFKYTDGITERKTATVPDWLEEIPNESFDRYYLIDGMDYNVNTKGTAFTDINDVAIFGFGFKPNPVKALQSITVNKTTGSDNNWLGVFGATGVVSTTLTAESVRKYYSSRVIDGYIANGKIFFDANLNGALDENEPFTITLADGSFDLNVDVEKFDTNQNGELDYTEGQFVQMGGMDIIGGVDAATGLPMATPLTSTLNSTVVTPLTTIIAEMVQQGTDPATAEAGVKAALGLPSGVDLGSYDPLEAIAKGDAQGISVFGSMIVVQNTIVQMAKFLDGVSEKEVAQLAFSGISAIANQTKSNTPVDLGKAETIQAILQGAITKAAQSDPQINPTELAASAAAAAQIMALGNQMVGDLVASGRPIKDIATDITKLQAVSVGQVAVGLSELAAGTVSVEEFLANNTKEAILSRMEKVQVNDPTVRPEVKAIDFSNPGTDGGDSSNPSPLPADGSVNPSPTTPNNDGSVNPSPTTPNNDGSVNPSPTTPNNDGGSDTSLPPITRLPEFNGIFFDPNFYLGRNLDVAAAVQSGAFGTAFEHFSKFGFAEGRAPNAVFASDYLTKNQDVATAVTQGFFKGGFEHFIKYGMAEDRDPSSRLAGFDMFYLAENPDVAQAVKQSSFKNGLEHLIHFGMLEGRDPQPRYSVVVETFDPTFYSANNPDVAQAVQQGLFRNSFEHFVNFGMKESRNPSLLFNNSYYLGQNSDVAAAVTQGLFKSGFEHFMKFGMAEGRVGATIVGSDSADRIEGNAGANIIFGNAGNDTLMGAGGNDQLYGNEGDDFLNGNQGRDAVYGGKGNDVIHGGKDDDLISGDVGNDLLVGDLGNDTLIGGAGEDVFVLDAATGVDAIVDFQAGQDRLGLFGGLKFEQLAIAQGTGINAQNTLVRIAANQELLAILSDVSASSITNSAFTVG
ncbi:hypothetical protein H6G03_32270, partial [Planktothrix sp. FACHB-1375]